ncbi:MAG: electron transfer flavoprotein subunit beta/FixA family protein [Candidatus Lokiarchaeota archaeon]|nr:electron transfer flavoprotein subunit beta/FixA family protein [Candidatus Lokiarchaeota archaeon]
MKIFVCIKQVPGVSEVKIDPNTNTLVREGVLSIINPNDRNAIELALILKEKQESEVIALSMGPPQAEEALREALAMGVDKGFLLSDKAFAGADTLATSHTLGLAIKKILNEPNSEEKYLIICGAQAIDGDTGQVPPELAEELGIPQITYVQNIELSEEKIVVERKFRATEIVIIETKLPALISVLTDINKPRYPSIAGIMKAYEKANVIQFDSNTLNADKSKIGLKGSMTEVRKIFIPKRKVNPIMLEGSTEEVVQKLCQHLKEDKIF